MYKYILGMTSSGMRCISDFIKSGPGVLKLIRGDGQTDEWNTDARPTLPFLYVVYFFASELSHSVEASFQHYFNHRRSCSAVALTLSVHRLWRLISAFRPQDSWTLVRRFSLLHSRLFSFGFPRARMVRFPRWRDWHFYESERHFNVSNISIRNTLRYQDNSV
jgi:hypothetical protein